MDALRSLVRSWKHPRSRQHSASSIGSVPRREELEIAEEERSQQQEQVDDQTAVWQPELPLSKYPSESWPRMGLCHGMTYEDNPTTPEDG
ncbi:hypothetical protein BGW42_006364 [Actinomortierella wolfii]|nr:hypothetical protein BGW42_006364 [Actinomortierella wolfii]